MTAAFVVLFVACGGQETPTGPDQNPVPSVTAVSPTNVTAGEDGFTLTVTGADFIASSVVRWNDANRPTTYVDGTTLEAAIPASDVAAGGTASITVFNPAPGGGVSGTLAVSVVNPVPSVTAVSPDEATTGQDDFTLTVEGASFVTPSIVRWNGSDRPTTYVDGGTLRATIPASDVGTAGNASITVFTPPPGGGVSNDLTLSVVNPAPLLTSLSSQAEIAGRDEFTLTLVGADFLASSVVRWNGSDRPTTYVAGDTLQAAIPASDVATPDTASITVFTPSPGGGVSDGLPFMVLPDSGFQIAFRSFPEGYPDEVRSEIYVMTGDGTTRVRLTNLPGYDGGPLWSPDGSKIAFFQSQNSEVYVMNVNGTDLVNLTNSSASDAGAAWAPDGTKLAFQSNRDGNGEIYVVNVDGTGLVNLTDSSASDGGAVWSPDGSQLAFVSDRDGDNDIYVMNADGTGVVNLTNSTDQEGNPRWSPDGSKIAFEFGESTALEVYVMNADGTGVVNVSNSASNDYDPAWSPDGSELAFVSDGDIDVVNPDGTGLTNLTNTALVDYSPGWSPDGSKIVFHEYLSSDHVHIVVMNADGTGRVDLTSPSGAMWDDYPRWRPRP